MFIDIKSFFFYTLIDPYADEMINYFVEHEGYYRTISS